MTRYRTSMIITYLVAYLFAIGTAVRFLTTFRGYPFLWTIVGLLAAFLLFMAIEPWLTRRSEWYTHLYLAVQSGIIIALALVVPAVDYFAGLFFTLALQAMLVFPARTGFGWIGVFTATMTALMIYGQGWGAGLPLILMNGIAFFFLGSYVFFIRQAETAREEAETARKESQGLLAELQAAHRELQVYTAQAEELAVAAERNRLARDLHDSVTQSLYSLTLFTQAARELAEAGNLELVKRNLARIADTAGQGLKEMRLLVYELRPLALKDEGLVRALQHRLDMVERRSGVQTRLLVEPDGDVELPAAVEEALYRIAEEVLNNALKHAHAISVTVRMAVTPSTGSGQAPSTGSPVPAAQVQAGQAPSAGAPARPACTCRRGTGGSATRARVPAAQGPRPLDWPPGQAERDEGQAGQAPSTGRRSELVGPSGLTADGRRLEFEVTDDGCGFDLESVKDKGGLGLTSIRERVNGLGGELSVCSAPGQGTRVKVEMEIKP